MNDEKAQNGGRNGNKWNPIVVAVLSAVLGSGGGIALVFNTSAGQSLVRPDPFTGTEAAQLDARLQHVEREMDTHVRRHPDAVNQFDRRITTLEVQYANIISGQHRIIERLDKITGD